MYPMSEPTSKPLRQRSRRFPPTASGLLLPLHDRRGGALGLTMYTASRQRVIAAQRAAWCVTRLLGPRALPGPREVLQIDEWSELVDSWQATLGPVTSVAAYSRKDNRTGTTMLTCREGRPVALVKVRSRMDALAREQALLSTLRDPLSPSIHVPRALGAGTTSTGLAWSAQEFVFTRPHRPVMELAATEHDRLAEGMRAAFEQLGLRRTDDPADDPTGDTGLDTVPAHRDLTPWNLRRDHRGAVWLFDWEDAGWAPPGADADYLALTRAALRGGAAPRVSARNRAYWRGLLEQRVAEGHIQPINTALLRLLREDSKP